MTTLCPHCGTNNRTGSNFCNNCGTDLRDGDESSAASVEEHPEDQSAHAEDESTVDSLDPTREQSSTNVPVETGDEPDAEESSRPLFDLGLASVEQPWLGSQEATVEGREGDSAVEPIDETPAINSRQRLVTGVQGLLDPLNISGGDEALPRFSPEEPDPSLTAEESERIRRAMGDAPIPAMQLRTPKAPRFPRLRLPWVFWLIGLAIGLPVLGILSGPTGDDPLAWPGVDETFAAVEALPPGAHVLVYFAYDPATSGEMDLLAVPALRHLFDQRSNLTFYTLSPNGLATVRRTARLAVAGRVAENEVDVALRRFTARTAYLSGGAAVLPLVGITPQGAQRPSSSGRTTPLPKPTLAVLLAPRTEDLQQWLELVQPWDGTPVVAYTAAGVDPMARPYLDSGQLQGLVSGFDGAAAYTALLDEPESAQSYLRLQAVAQNWGHFAMFFILLTGNVIGFLQRNRDES